MSLYIIKIKICFFYFKKLYIQFTMKLFLKLSSYYFSLLPLWILFLIQYGATIILLIFWIIYIILWLLIYVVIRSKIRGSKIPVEVNEISNWNNEQLLYLMTYVIPFVFVNYQSLNWQVEIRTIISVLFLLIVIWFIYCKTNLFSANPILSILWWNTYKWTVKIGSSQIKCTILSKGFLGIEFPIQKSGLYLIDDEVIVVLKS